MIGWFVYNYPFPLRFTSFRSISIYLEINWVSFYFWDLLVINDSFYNFKYELDAARSGLIFREWKEDVWKEEEIACSMMQHSTTWRGNFSWQIRYQLKAYWVKISKLQMDCKSELKQESHGWRRKLDTYQAAAVYRSQSTCATRFSGGFKKGNSTSSFQQT